MMAGLLYSSVCDPVILKEKKRLSYSTAYTAYTKK